MLDQETIKELLARKEISDRNKLLICMAHDPVSPKKVSDIRELAISVGLRAAKNWNISKILSNAKSLVVRTTAGWELTSSGRSLVAEIAGPILPAVTILVVSALRKQLPTIVNIATRSFVEESVKALEAKLYRSAIVLSWVGAISVLYDHVINNCLKDFNSEAARRDSRWKEAKTQDDLTRMKEYDFLQILASQSVIGKNVKEELELCLKLRNGCGHPNSLIVGEHKASAHVETLIQNIFARF
ncbi:hypothetical protein [Ralstonia mannitolilytica]|uniref:hypothetical protein n=1 Tax=Ralstonia mannitolilytica TaxID=105219 RepID=UPI00292E867D|nr:hypothetical protein [Ralstonia mannitolilytica]